MHLRSWEQLRSRWFGMYYLILPTRRRGIPDRRNPVYRHASLVLTHPSTGGIAGCQTAIRLLPIFLLDRRRRTLVPHPYHALSGADYFRAGRKFRPALELKSNEITLRQSFKLIVQEFQEATPFTVLSGGNGSRSMSGKTGAGRLALVPGNTNQNWRYFG